MRYYKPIEDMKLVNVQQYTGDVTYFGNLLSNKGSDIYLNLGAGGTLGYESINNSVSSIVPGVALNEDSKFLYGALVSLDTEIYLSDHFVLLARAAQRWYPSSEVSKWNFNAGIGIKFIIITH